MRIKESMNIWGDIEENGFENDPANPNRVEEMKRLLGKKWVLHPEYVKPKGCVLDDVRRKAIKEGRLPV